MRKQFNLPEEDAEFLDSIGYKWETIQDANGMWVLIHDYPVPQGYTASFVNVALKIDGGYPVTQIDMAYFNPHLIKKDGSQIGALENQPIDNEVWQRWSRHRTGHNPWRVGLDNILTQMQLVTYWMEREIK